MTEAQRLEQFLRKDSKDIFKFVDYSFEKTNSISPIPAAYSDEQANPHRDAKTFLQDYPLLSSVAFGVLTCWLWSHLARRVQSWRTRRGAPFQQEPGIFATREGK